MYTVLHNLELKLLERMDINATFASIYQLDETAFVVLLLKIRKYLLICNLSCKHHYVLSQYFSD